MKIIKKVVLSDEENNLVEGFVKLLGTLKYNLEKKDMDELWNEIDRLQTHVLDVWDNFDIE